MARTTKGKLWTSILGVILVAALVAGYKRHLPSKANYGAADKTALDQAKKSYGSLPLAFEPNRGQTDSRVQFLARSIGYQVFLTSASSATLEFNGAAGKVHVVTMNLAGTNSEAKAQPEVKATSVSNYYLGNDQSKWVTGIPNYAEVRYNDLYPGVAVVYQGDNMRFRYDFEVAPGADPTAIRWSYNGADDVKVDQQGALIVSTSDGDQIASSKPYIYQEYGGVKRQVEGGYRLSGKEVAFETAHYDSTRPLVIDPSVSNGTLLGTSVAPGRSAGNTVLNAVANSGTAITATGYTLSATFPTVAGFEAAPQGNEDVVVSSLNYAMTALTFSTYLGGSGDERGMGIALDSSGNAVVVGFTQSGTLFPAMNALNVVAANTTTQHSFVAKFTSAGTLVLSSPFYGTGAGQALGVALQGTTNIHITGSTTANDLMSSIRAPATSFQSTNNSTLPGPNAYYVDFSLTGHGGGGLSVAYATYFGGLNSDVGTAIAFDPTANDAVIAGQATSFTGAAATSLTQSVAVGANAGLEITSPGTHAFVAKFNPAASGSASLVFSQAIGKQGGSGFEAATGVAVDSLGNIYVTGNLTEANPATEPSFTSPVITLDGTGTSGGTAQDGFVLELPPGGVAAIYGTLVTGDENTGNNGGVSANAITNVTGIAVDALGQAYISGFVNNAAGNSDMIRRRINANGFIVGGTPFLHYFPSQGGAVTPVGDIILKTFGGVGASNGIAYDPTSGNACVAGFVNSNPPLLDPTAAIIQASALQPTAPATGISTGIVVCNLFNSDTVISSTANTGPTTFLFSMPVGGNPPVNQFFDVVNNDPTLFASDYTISPVDGSGQILISQYNPTPPSRWLTLTKQGAQVTMSINAVAGTFAAGLYSVTFQVTPNQGDNVGVAQTIAVSLSILSGHDVNASGRRKPGRI